MKNRNRTNFVREIQKRRHSSRQEWANYALKKPKNSLGKKVKKIKTKKDLDKNTGIKTPGAEVLLLNA